MFRKVRHWNVILQRILMSAFCAFWEKKPRQRKHSNGQKKMRNHRMNALFLSSVDLILNMLSAHSFVSFCFYVIFSNAFHVIFTAVPHWSFPFHFPLFLQYFGLTFHLLSLLRCRRKNIILFFGWKVALVCRSNVIESAKHDKIQN